MSFMDTLMSMNAQLVDEERQRQQLAEEERPASPVPSSTTGSNPESVCFIPLALI